MSKRLVYGLGLNDMDYPITEWVYTTGTKPSGYRKTKITWMCPFYIKWRGMLERCYSKRCHKKRPTYKECSVCPEWLLFSNFRKWMISQDWEGKHLDKDLLSVGNKVYSPSTCIFVSTLANTFIIDSNRIRGKYLIGCYWKKSNNKLQAQCNNPFTDKREYLGLYNTEIEAHLTWKKRKHELACRLADSEYVTDERVDEALRKRYKNYTIVEEHLS